MDRALSLHVVISSKTSEVSKKFFSFKLEDGTVEGFIEAGSEFCWDLFRINFKEKLLLFS